MSRYSNVIRSKTPDIKSIELIDKKYFTKNMYSLVKRGVPFVILDYFKIQEESEIINTICNELNEKFVSARLQSNTNDYANNREYKDMRLKDYFYLLQNKQNGGFPYTVNLDIDNGFLSLCKINLPIPKHENQFREPKLWIGSNNTTTPLHKDSTDNFIFQLSGKKIWTIYSIKDTEYLYFKKNKYGSYENELAEFEISEIDLDDINSEKHPLFLNAKPFYITINPGEALYLPYGWGHHVKNITSTIMINLWFKLDDYRPLILQ